MMNLIVFYITTCPANAEMGVMKHYEPRSIGHARAIIVRLHRTGCNHAWVMNNDNYLFGYIRDEETGETFWDSYSTPDSELAVN